MDAAAAFGKVLRRLRLARGLSQEQLGLDADLRRTYISILELGQQQPSLVTIFKLSRALGCSPGQLVTLAYDELVALKQPKPHED